MAIKQEEIYNLLKEGFPDADIEINDLAGVVANALREGLGRNPRHHVLIVKRIRHAQHLSAGVLRVVVHALGA